MLVQVGAVEIAERVGVLWEMRGDPVENHADMVLMKVIDQTP